MCLVSTHSGKLMDLFERVMFIIIPTATFVGMLLDHKFKFTKRQTSVQ